MNVSISPIFGFQLGIDYVQDVEGGDGNTYDLVRLSLGIVFVHIIVGNDAGGYS